MRFFGICLLWLLPAAASAQNFMGITTSPAGGTHRTYLNPALAADAPAPVYIHVGAANLHINNNYVRYQAPYSLLTLLAGSVPGRFRQANGNLRFQPEYTTEILDGAPKNVTLWGEVRGPAGQVRVGERSTVGLSTRLRMAAQMTGASQELLALLRTGLQNASPFAVPAQGNSFGANTNTYAEVGATYATELLDADGARLLAGVTAKYLIGYTAGHLVNRGLQYRLVADPAVRNGVYVQLTQLDATLYYTNFLRNRALSPRTLLSGNAPGRGFGLDLGLAYVLQPDPDGPVLRLGAAVTDIGAISFRGEAYTYNFTTDSPTGGVRFQSEDFDGVNGSEAIAERIRSKLDAQRGPNAGRFRSGLPTSLNLSGEWQGTGGLGVAVVWLQSLRSALAVSMHQPSLVAVTPRYDRGPFGVALPITYINRGLAAGVMLKVGPAWLGSDNLLGLIGNGNNGIRPRGVDIYAGLGFTIDPRPRE